MEDIFFRIAEILATITGFCCVFFEIKQKIALWYFGIISAALFLLVFFHQSFYAYALFQVYFIATSIYGLTQWKKSEKATGEEMPISRISLRLFVILLVLAVVLTFGLWRVLLTVNENSTYAFFDAVISTLSIIATWMLAKKYIEQWGAWFIADAISVGVFFSRGLYPTTLLYTAYVVMAVTGFILWRKQLKKQNQAV